MNTEEIADALGLTAKLMELHDENAFKARSLSNASFRLGKSNPPLAGKTREEIESMEGIGKGIAAKIMELIETGTTRELKALLEKTPAGVIEMMSVKGIGPKKVRQLWKELNIESVGELLYACNENRLVDLKGFGEKTQESIRKCIEFMVSSQGKAHYGRILPEAEALVKKIKTRLMTDLVSLTGQMHRKCNIVEKIEILIASENSVSEKDFASEISIPLQLIFCSEADFHFRLVETSASPSHFESLNLISAKGTQPRSEQEVYEAAGVQYVEPELREGLFEIEKAKTNSIQRLVEFTDLKGCLHNHSNYSDGMYSLKEMALKCRDLGYEYFGIADHSQSAFYADGLKPEKVLQQHEEIDHLNQQLAPFRIFKGIESDILNDGSLDYDEELLKTFDYVVASVHSNLKMSEEKAMKRLITAIENPYTTILGHPTGRLLLSRDGYPIDHKKIIDACAANGVIIELNANPYRLDIDWQWLPYCMEKGVLVSINPDAHHTDTLQDMYYGVCSARKGMLTREMCFNARTLSEMESYLSERLR